MEMKKLDYKGSGLGMFLTIIGVFFIAIILITYVANKNGMGSHSYKEEPIENPHLKEYKQYEVVVKESAVKYQEQNYPYINEGDTFYINISKLNIEEKITKNCSGYVEFGKQNGSYIYNPYLKCGTYKTNGYINDLDK